MQNALAHYYNSRDPFGVDGDFITAPEISQLFGEIIGIWAAQQWMQMGCPQNIHLIELGPGRGTLMADLLRGTRHVKGFHDALSVILVETSAVLRNKQKDNLNEFNVTWHDHLNAVSKDKPAIIIANEFFDALPVRQFRYQHDEWQELYIRDTEKVWQAVNNPPMKTTLRSPSKGDIYEFSTIQAEYARLIASFKGAKLIIDYGYEHSAYGDSLQALYKHRPCQVTEHIGDADITTHVDFECLSQFFNNAQIKTQAQFLQENGIAIRHQQLNNPGLRSGYERLIHPAQMGSLFKVLEVSA